VLNRIKAAVRLGDVSRSANGHKKHLLQSGNPSIASCSISIAFISLKIFSEKGAMVKFESLALAGSFPKFSAVR